MEQRSKGWLRYYCAAGEYDPTTRKPTIADPDESTLYYVPAEHPTADNQWVEWQYDTEGDRWEMQGTTEVTVSPVTTAQIDAIANDETVISSNVLQATGLTYLWQTLKNFFSGIGHSHSASDITSGTLGISRGGTGASTAATARTNLGVTAANVVDGNAIAPSSVAATGAVSGSSVSDSVGSLADLRDSVSQCAKGRRGALLDISFTKLQSLSPGAYTVGNGSSAIGGIPSQDYATSTGYIFVMSASAARIIALLVMDQGTRAGVYVTSGANADNWVKIN